MKIIYYIGSVYEITEEKYSEMKAWFTAYFNSGRTALDVSNQQGYHEYTSEQLANERVLCKVDNWF